LHRGGAVKRLCVEVENLTDGCCLGCADAGCKNEADGGVAEHPEISRLDSLCQVRRMTCDLFRRFFEDAVNTHSQNP